ncbi:hypothetical protein SDC9_199712 [bioreactor metagenome]|uniref:Uncharacterized protein n=1 Tax=bioreactor metagenome TaxID=1076179 RepID=A0A645ILT4_9ZZZZ
MGEDFFLLKGHRAVLIGYHIAAVRDIAGSQLDPAGRGLQGGPSGIAYPGVSPEDGEDSRITAGRQALRTVFHRTDLALCGQVVYIRNGGGLKRSPVPQRGYGIIRHTVTDDEYVLHYNHFLFGLPPWVKAHFSLFSSAGW